MPLLWSAWAPSAETITAPHRAPGSTLKRDRRLDTTRALGQPADDRLHVDRQSDLSPHRALTVPSATRLPLRRAYPVLRFKIPIAGPVGQDLDNLGSVETSYQDIANHLRASILRGDYRQGRPIPTEAELGEQFEVSRTTVRKALKVLRAEGWLDVRTGGRGTVVRARQLALRYSPDMPRGGPFGTATGGQMIRGRGVDVVDASPRQVTWLRLDPGASVVVRRRELVGVDEEPIQLYTSYLPLDLVEGTPLAGPAMVTGGVYTGLVKIGHAPVRCAEEVSTRMPTPDEAAALRLGDRTPVLDVLRRSWEQGGRIVEALHIVAGGDRNVLVYDGLTLDPERF